MAGGVEATPLREDDSLPVPGSHRQRSSHFRPDLEGLRAVAVLLVLVFHAGVPGFAGGYVGVDVFFVLSGFLITGLLLRELDVTGTVSLTSFYARRARRLLPAASIVLVVTLVGSLLILPVIRVPSVSLDVASAAAYVSNIRFGLEANDYFAANAAPSPVLHFWSLSLEEQFYLFWPTIVILMWRLRHTRRAMAIGIAGLSVLSLAAGVWLTGVNPSWAFYLLPTRAWELGVGALLAAAPLAEGRLPGWARGAAVVAGLVLIGLASIAFTPETQFPGLYAVVPVLGAALVIWGGISQAPSRASGLLGVPPLRYIGRISYSAYLWHWPMLVLAGAAFGPLYLSVPIVILAVAVAGLTQSFVEAPMREGFVLGRRPRINLVQGLTATVMVVLLCGGAAAYARSQVDAKLGDLSAQLDDLATWTPGGYCDASIVAERTKCVHGDPSSGTTVALFGDSMAGQWFGALDRIAARRGWRLVSLARASCTAVTVETINQMLGRVDDACTRWRELAIARLNAESPLLIVMANHRTAPVVDGNAVTDPQQQLSLWTAGLTRTFERLASPSGRVVVVGDVPSGTDPAECITQHLDDQFVCTRDPAQLAPWYAAERIASESAHQVFLDPTPWLCQNGACPDVIDGLIVYRDSAHLSSAFTAALAPELDSSLMQLNPMLATLASLSASPGPIPSGPVPSTDVHAALTDVVLKDSFSRSSETGWGVPDQGRPWIQSPVDQATATVDGEAGSMTIGAFPGGVFAAARISSPDVDVSARWNLEAFPGGAPLTVHFWPRVIDGDNQYRFYVVVSPSGELGAAFASDAAGTSSALGPYVRVGSGYTPGQWWNVRVQASGMAPTHLRGRVWKDGDPEPTTWSLEISDDTQGLQVPPLTVKVGIYAGEAQTTSPLGVRFDDIAITEPSPSPSP